LADGRSGNSAGVATREQVRALVEQGLEYPEIGRRLGVPPGQAYLIGTGMAADGGHTYTEAERQRPGVLTTAQFLLGITADNPTTKQVVLDWIKRRVDSDEPMRRAKENRTAAPPEMLDPDDVRDAITVLSRDHNQVRYLNNQLKALPGHREGGSAKQMSARGTIVNMITERLSEHESAEEEHFWPAVRKALPDGDRWADGALEQEQKGKDTLSALGKLDPDSDEFDDLVDQLVGLLAKHVAYEERLFLRLREAMSEDDLNELGGTLLTAKGRAPARPHPRAPKKPLKATGAAGTATDKARNRTGNRPAKRKGRAKPNVEGEAK
jgi:hemerythrin-like domain-containing protein